LLVAGVVVSTWMAVRARRAEQAANLERSTANAVNEFLQNDLLAQASAYEQARPDVKPDPNLTVRTALDRAAASVTRKFETQPVIEASIRLTIGKTYLDLGLLPEAQQQFERVLVLRRRVLGEQHADTLSTMNDLAEVYDHQGKYAQADQLLSKVVEVRRRTLGEENPTTLINMNNLASVYQEEGKNDQAEALFEKVLDARRRVLGEEHPDTMSSLNNLGLL